MSLSDRARKNFVHWGARGVMLSRVMLALRYRFHARADTDARRCHRGYALWVKQAGALLALLFWAAWLRAAVVSVQDKGAGVDYMSGEPITLPAAQLCTNPFRNGAQVIRNRSHTARPAVFDSAGRLNHKPSDPTSALVEARTNPPATGSGAKQPLASAGAGVKGLRSSPAKNGFPAYLEGQQYVWFLQEVRHYTNYSCTVTVDCPSTFYLLVDNRVNDYLDDSSYNDPAFGPPDTQWFLKEGWKRVNTGLTPVLTPTNAGDYVGIDEGNKGTINQIYAVYARTLSKPGFITLGTEFDGNIYCLVVSTNPAPFANAAKPAAPKEAASRQAATAQ